MLPHHMADVSARLPNHRDPGMSPKRGKAHHLSRRSPDAKQLAGHPKQERQHASPCPRHAGLSSPPAASPPSLCSNKDNPCGESAVRAVCGRDGGREGGMQGEREGGQGPGASRARLKGGQRKRGETGRAAATQTYAAGSGARVDPAHTRRHKRAHNLQKSATMGR